MAKLWTQSIRSKCLKFTQRPALDPSLCLADSCARHLCSPSIERNINSKEEQKESKGKGPSIKHLQYREPPFRGPKRSHPQISAQAPLCFGVFREGKAVLYGGLFTPDVRGHWSCDSRIQECQLSQTLGV